ncbi:hypothetical protein EV385_0386 [Krasilnikovia cinnamomea]|uniref:Uncharacterized protein n=1 Tax=Krasilnikovia cinnamomea TaxID=349313 RepID=A0A4Q7ZDE3_9ACTN|nr:hypothetical protein [Krasilnikovia cinnamomea]RZU48668.1 hypothetical protein EV385_0386 [Krasilnikovia cinnamomea]
MPDGVQIDTDGVGDVAHGMRGQANGGFAEAAQRGTALHRHGVEFGARITPSSVVTEAKTRYAQALENTEANLRAYRLAAGVLAEAADEIARMFASSDMSSAAAQRKIQDVIAGAVRMANVAIDPTTRGPLL